MAAELFNIIPEGNKYLDGLKTWLIMQKRSGDWNDRISTGLAVKSIILYGSDWYPASPDIRIESKGENFSPLRINLGTDAGGYYRYTWEEGEMLDDGLELKIQKGGKAPVWGSLYEKSSMDIDPLLPSGSDLLIRRIFLVEKEQNGQKGWLATSGEDLEVGSRIKIRLEIEASQAVDYVQIRDYRPAPFEPDKSLSGYHWGRGISWYQNQGDLYTDFYIHRLPKGFSFFEYDFYVEQKGDFSKGYTEIQSQYAPEFMARSAGGRIIVR